MCLSRCSLSFFASENLQAVAAPLARASPEAMARPSDSAAPSRIVFIWIAPFRLPLLVGSDDAQSVLSRQLSQVGLGASRGSSPPSRRPARCSAVTRAAPRPWPSRPCGPAASIAGSGSLALESTAFTRGDSHGSKTERDLDAALRLRK